MIFFTFIVCQVDFWAPVLAAQHIRTERINREGDLSLLPHCQGLPQLPREGGTDGARECVSMFTCDCEYVRCFKLWHFISNALYLQRPLFICRSYYPAKQLRIKWFLWHGWPKRISSRFFWRQKAANGPVTAAAGSPVEKYHLENTALSFALFIMLASGTVIKSKSMILDQWQEINS